MNWISPVAIELGPLKIHWYGLMYLLSFVIAYFLLQYTFLGKHFSTSEKNREDLLLYSILGILIGGRLGYVLIYNLPYYLTNPFNIFTIWDGGMSFHGGVIGVILAFVFFSKKHRVNFLKCTDLAAVIAPIGIMLGRIGNFINAELYGRISSSQSLCINFPTDPTNCRYPSQLLESATEGLILFIILFFTTKQLQKSHSKPGYVSALFLILYSIFRFMVEFFREPDPQLGFLLLNLTMGQLLSSAMLISGISILIYLKTTSKK